MRRKIDINSIKIISYVFFFSLPLILFVGSFYKKEIDFRNFASEPSSIELDEAKDFEENEIEVLEDELHSDIEDEFTSASVDNLNQEQSFADLNQDDKINIQDFALFLRYYEAGNKKIDFNQNQIAHQDEDDLQIFVEEYVNAVNYLPIQEVVLDTL